MRKRENDKKKKEREREIHATINDPYTFPLRTLMSHIALKDSATCSGIDGDGAFFSLEHQTAKMFVRHAVQ